MGRQFASQTTQDSNSRNQLELLPERGIRAIPPRNEKHFNPQAEKKAGDSMVIFTLSPVGLTMAASRGERRVSFRALLLLAAEEQKLDSATSHIEIA